MQNVIYYEKFIYPVNEFDIDKKYVANTEFIFV